MLLLSLSEPLCLHLEDRGRHESELVSSDVRGLCSIVSLWA